MDKNILEEYQKRVEEISKILEDNQEFVTEGIEVSTERIDNRLAELQKKLEEAEMPIDMSDAGIGSLGGFVRDRRIATVRVSYSDDREGYLLSEYDKRRIDPDEPNANVERVVEEIRKEREAKRQVQRDSITAEMEGLIAKQEKLAKIHEFEIAKEQMTIELREAADRIRKNINDKTAEMGEENQKSVDLANETSMYEKTLTLYQGKNHTIYTATKKELEKCRVKAEKAKGKAVKIARAIGKLTQDLGAIEKLLDKIQEIDKNNQRVQEEQAWAEYEAEQEAIKRNEEQEEQKSLGDEDHILDEERNAYFEYAHEQDVKDIDTLKKYAERQDKGEFKQPEAKGRPQRKQIPPTLAAKWKIEKVTFSIEGGSQPVYRVIASNGEEQKEVTSTDIQLLDKANNKDEIATLEREYLLMNPEKLYDKGLAIALQKADKIFGTESLAEYRSLIKGEIQPEKHTEDLEISYDFSGLRIKPDETMKRLQKLAKAGRTGKVVSEFKGRPSFLTRLIEGIFRFTKALPETVSLMNDIEKNEAMTFGQDAILHAEAEKREINENMIRQNWEAMHGEEGFDIEEFVKDMSTEEACKYKILQDEYEEQKRPDKCRQFRDGFKDGVRVLSREEAEQLRKASEVEQAKESQSEEDKKAPEVPQQKTEESLKNAKSDTDERGKSVIIGNGDWTIELDDEDEEEREL